MGWRSVIVGREWAVSSLNGMANRWGGLRHSGVCRIRGDSVGIILRRVKRASSRAWAIVYAPARGDGPQVAGPYVGLRTYRAGYGKAECAGYEEDVK